MINQVNPLVALAISPQMQVITPDGEMPDSDSVAAFAQDQGLAADTVRWLFNPGRPVETAATSSGAPADNAATELTPASPTQPSPALGIAHTIRSNDEQHSVDTQDENQPGKYPALPTQLTGRLSPSEPSYDEVYPGAGPLAPQGLLPVQMARNEPGSEAPTPRLAGSEHHATDPIGSQAEPGSADQTALQVLTSATAGAEPAKKALTLRAHDAMGLAQMRSTTTTLDVPEGSLVPEGSQLVQRPGAPGETRTNSEASVPTAVASATSAKAMQNALGGQMTAAGVPAHTADNAATPTGPETAALVPTAQAALLGRLQIIKANWEKTSTPIADKRTPSQPPAEMTIDLDDAMSIDRDPKLKMPIEFISAESTIAKAPLAGAGDTMAKHGLGLQASASGRPTEPWLDSTQGSQKFQELSQRLGEAIGQRLISAMERGQWHLKLTLKPAHLGHIEVDMRMREGGLDANFVASQAATRELLQDGLSRLKSSLSDIGMDVASMSVGDGQARHSGGESTLESRASKTSGAASNKGKPLTATDTANSPRGSLHDGLDVMV